MIHGQSGGAIFLSAKNIIISNCYFFDNANMNGGAIYLSKHSSSNLQNLLVEETIFSLNKAGDSGGAIFLAQDITYILGIISNCGFFDQSSYYGRF